MARDLIIDVGMHVGYDTEFYLAKGFDVVAIEANPALVEEAEGKFAAEIEAGRLRILGVAITERRETVSFAVASAAELSTVSAAEVALAERHGVDFDYVDVPGVPFAEILEEVGIPYYLKVDIEGSDALCVEALHHFERRPRYVSVESSIASAEPRLALDEVFGDIAGLWSLGYRRFKYVDQTRPHRPPDPPLEGTAFALPAAEAVAKGVGSGGFGRETPGPWRAPQALMLRGCGLRSQYLLGGWRGRWSSRPPGRLYRGLRSRVLGRPPIGFFDLHAALGPDT